MQTYALAIDIGASGGRHTLGSMQAGKFVVEEIYRFSNGMHEHNGHLCWDIDALFAHVLAGMKKCAERGILPASVGIDTWGVDFVLLDANGERIGDAIAYRDDRTRGMEAKLEQTLSYEELYQITGIAKQPYNTIYQLMATPKEQIEQARRCLFTPDYLHYLLSGVMANEYTISSTSALLDAHTRTWDQSLLEAAGIPASLFPEPPKPPCTVLGGLRPDIAAQVGFDCKVVLPASHDTGSAFMAIPDVDENTLCLSSGTWSLLGVLLDQPETGLASLRAGFTNEGAFGGKICYIQNIMGMWILQRVRHELNDPYSYAEMVTLAQAGASYSHTFDVTDNRFLAPNSMTVEIESALLQSGHPKPENTEQLLYCINHSLAQCYARAIASLSKHMSRQYTTLSIVGGGGQNQLLNQLTAKETGLAIRVGASEGTARGNLMAQLIALGICEADYFGSKQ